MTKQARTKRTQIIHRRGGLTPLEFWSGKNPNKKFCSKPKWKVRNLWSNQQSELRFYKFMFYLYFVLYWFVLVIALVAILT